MSDKYRISGWAFFVYGVTSLVGFLIAFTYGVTQMPVYISMPFYMHILINLALTINTLTLLTGYYLLRQNPLAHRFAFPLAVTLLVFAPVGTATGFLYLYQRAKHT